MSPRCLLLPGSLMGSYPFCLVRDCRNISTPPSVDSGGVLSPRAPDRSLEYLGDGRLSEGSFALSANGGVRPAIVRGAPSFCQA